MTYLSEQREYCHHSLNIPLKEWILLPALFGQLQCHPCLEHKQKVWGAEDMHAGLFPQQHISVLLPGKSGSSCHAGSTGVFILDFGKYKLLYSPQSVTRKPTLVFTGSPMLSHGDPK